MQVTMSDSFELRFDRRNVLLFKQGADATVSLLAVTDDEWSRAETGAEPDAKPVDTIRRLFADHFA